MPTATAACSLACACLLHAADAGPESLARTWRFDGTLQEAQGFGAFMPNRNVTEKSYALADGRRALHLRDGRVTAEDDLVFDLLPGMHFSLRVKFNTLPDDDGNLLSRDLGPGGYFLRVDPSYERRAFSFFANTDNHVEPRVTSRQTVRTGVWYDLAAGWDGTDIWLSVNGDMTRRRRPGTGIPIAVPLTLAATDAEIADLRFHAGTPTTAESDALAPGLRVNASLAFDRVPTADHTELLVKPGEYMIRYENIHTIGWSGFSFFVRLDGRWEPRLSVPTKAEPGVRYNLVAAWDGRHMSLSVNGRSATALRLGAPAPQGRPLTLNTAVARFRHHAVRICTRPNVSLENFRTAELMPYENEPFTLKADLVNVSGPVPAAHVRAVGPAGCTVSPADLDVGDLASRAHQPCAWRIDPGTNETVMLRFEVLARGEIIHRTAKRLATMPRQIPDRSARGWNPPVSGVQTHYLDAETGDDTRNGCTPETAWRSFRNVRGRVLGPGERLLLKRGCVFDEELTVTARGRPDDWAEIGAYGTGPRPTIRRTRDIDERCAYVTDSSCLAIRDLIVCDAGKGLIVLNRDPKAAGRILIERCLAHHIEGLYRFNAHGVPEWRDREGAPGEGRGGLALTGAGMRHGVLRDCEMYQCSVAFSVSGDDMWIGQVYCHDNFCPNTSPHPTFTSTYRAWLVDSVFEASGYLASCGTMGIMLGYNQGLSIRGCHFRDMPHTGLCGDEGGIDFEAGGDNAEICDCTFRNNAGAAIEVLGLRSPQARNTRIAGCRFARNNHAHMLGPSEIYIWGDSRDRTIVCSSGLIEGNGAVLAPGVSFFTNVSDLVRADWTLRSNRVFATATELDRAFPLNDPPAVDVGTEIWTDSLTTCLTGRATDDGHGAHPLALAWEQLEGPGRAHLVRAQAATTPVTLPRPGDYRFNLTASDGRLWRTARTAVHVLPPGTQVLRAWTFARNLDTEGWTTNALGTVFERFPNGNVNRQTHAYPVAHAVGDRFVLALKDAAAGALLSADALDVAPAKDRRLLVKMQNHTTAERMRLFWTTDTASSFAKTDSASFSVRPQDATDRLYTVSLPETGTIRRLKLVFSDGTPVTGTVRIDYLALVGSALPAAPPAASRKPRTHEQMSRGGREEPHHARHAQPRLLRRRLEFRLRPRRLD